MWPDDALILLFSALDSGFPSFCSGVVAAMRWRALTLPWPDLFGRQPASSGIVSADDKASFWLSEVVGGWGGLQAVDTKVGAVWCCLCAAGVLLPGYHGLSGKI